MSDLTVRPQDLGRLFEEVRDAVVVAEAFTGRIVLWNQAATQIFGYSPAEALELRVEALVPERLRARHMAGLSRYRETGRGVYIDSDRLLGLPAVRKGGEEITIEMSLSPITPVRDPKEADGPFVLAIVRDVTQRKKNEEALRRSEASLAEAQRMAHLGNWEWDARTGEEWWSDEVYRIYGFEPGQVAPGLESLINVMHPDDRGLLSGPFDAALYRGEPYDFEHRVLRPDRSVRVVQIGRASCRERV